MCNRIQKLLFSEYSDLEDIVLVESPFAETTRSGHGIRQVQIGLTPSKLIIAMYSIKSVEDMLEEHPLGSVDPDIDSFELVNAYPVDCVNLSVYDHKKRKTLKARFSNGNVQFFEIGGWESKKLWTVWCERVKFLAPYESGSSISETSVASNSSCSSLFVARSNQLKTCSGNNIMWCHYSPSQSAISAQKSWADPHVYLGSPFLNRGVNFTSLADLEKAHTYSARTCEARDENVNSLRLSDELEDVARDCVIMWESAQKSTKVSRKYGIQPFPSLLSGLGLYTFSKGDIFSLQVKRSVSEVRLNHVKRKDAEKRARLLRTVSQETLKTAALCPDKLFQLAEPQNKETLDIWTHDGKNTPYWGRSHYKIQQRQLRLFRKISSTSVQWQKQAKNTKPKRRPRSLHTLGGGREDICNNDKGASGDNNDSYDVNYLRKISTSTLAHQLTMIDKALFLQINILEAARILKDKNSYRAPNFRALLAFSYRITCLVSWSVTSALTAKLKALTILKFIGVAYWCHELRNAQSTVSVLRGLQSPAVILLHQSWDYIRKHHASKYRRFRDLSMRYSDSRMALYQSTFETMSEIPPYLPCLELLVSALFSRLIEFPNLKSYNFSSSCPHCLPKIGNKPIKTLDRLRSTSVFNVSPTSSLSLASTAGCSSEDHLYSISDDRLHQDLDKFFSPVSATCQVRRHLEDVEFFLESSQAAAFLYRIPVNMKIRSFLTSSHYQDLSRSFVTVTEWLSNQKKNVSCGSNKSQNIF